MNQTQVLLLQPLERRLTWLRALHLGWVLARHGARLMLSIAANGRLGRSRRSTGAILGAELAAFCEAAGATCCKFGQVLSMRPDLLPPDAIAPLGRLRDQLLPIDNSTARSIIARELAERATQIELADTALASATIASVYRGRLADGRLVAVKIRRPGIVDEVRTDVAILRAVGGWLGRLGPLRQIPLDEVVGQVADCVEQQLDFEREAHNATRIRANLARHSRVRVPRVLPEFSTDSVLTMEFIPNLILAAGPPEHHPAPGSHRALVAALRALYQMIFVDGLVHCDLHFGNLHIRDEGEAVMLDAGLVVELSDRDRLRFARFFYGLVTGAGRDCARVMREAALPPASEFDHSGFEDAVAALVEQRTGSTAADFDVAGFAVSMFNVQRRFGLRSSAGFVMPVMALLMFEGVARSRAPRLDFQREALPFLASVLLPLMLRERKIPFA